MSWWLILDMWPSETWSYFKKLLSVEIDRCSLEIENASWGHSSVALCLPSIHICLLVCIYALRSSPSTGRIKRKVKKMLENPEMLLYITSQGWLCDLTDEICFPLLPFSIEFDRDCDYFAIAGVTKKIKVYEYGTVIQDAVDIHYPENEMTCNSKIRYFFCCYKVVCI